VLPLIRHDWLIARNSLADLFGSWRDRLLLAFGALIGVAWLAQASQTPAAPLEPRLVAVLLSAAIVAGFSGHQAAARRLRYFVERSPLCSEALTPAGRRAFHALWAAATALVVAAAATVIHLRTGWSGLRVGAVGLAAQGFGVLASWLFLQTRAMVGSMRLPSLSLSSSSRSTRSNADAQWWSVIAQRQVLLHRSGPLALAFAAAGGFVVLSAATAVTARDQPSNWIIAGVVTAAGALLLARIDEQVVRFSAFAGAGRWASATAHWPAPFAFAGGGATVFVGLWALHGMDPVPQLISIGAAAAATAAVVTLRVWQCRLMPLATADRVLSIDAAACLMFGLLLWPLALAWASLRLVQLYCRTGTATWTLP
jgi:hypothetical protein